MRYTRSSWVETMHGWEQKWDVISKGNYIIPESPETSLSSGFRLLHPPLGQLSSLWVCASHLPKQLSLPLACVIFLLVRQVEWRQGLTEIRAAVKLQGVWRRKGGMWCYQRAVRLPQLHHNFSVPQLYLVHWPGLLLLCRHIGVCANRKDGNSPGGMSCQRKHNVILLPLWRSIELSLDSRALRSVLL